MTVLFTYASENYLLKKIQNMIHSYIPHIYQKSNLLFFFCITQNIASNFDDRYNLIHSQNVSSIHHNHNLVLEEE